MYNLCRTMTLTNCTVSGNSAAGNGGGLDNASGTVTIGNTIVAGNTATSSGPDAYGTFTSQGNNLIGKTDGSSGWVGSDLTGTVASPLNPLLAPLAYYGGPTETMAAACPAARRSARVTSRSFPAASPPTSAASPASSATPWTSAPSRSRRSPLVVSTTADGHRLPARRRSTCAGRSTWPISMPGANTITFDPTVFATAQTITLTGGQLALSNTSGAETITGPAAGVTVSGGGLSRVFQVDAGVTASISGLRSPAADRRVAAAAAFYNQLSGTATLTDCTVSGNSTPTVRRRPAERYGTTTLNNCTVSGNSANGAGGGWVRRRHDHADRLSPSAATPQPAPSRPGSWRRAEHPVAARRTLTDCTVSGNSARQRAIRVRRRIAATDHDHAWSTDHRGGEHGQPSCGPDVSGAFGSRGHNLIGETDGSSGWVGSDLTGTIASPLDALLVPLGNYGGPTQTMALLPGSPAIGNGRYDRLPGHEHTDLHGPARHAAWLAGRHRRVPVQPRGRVNSRSVDTNAAGLTLPGAVAWRISSPARPSLRPRCLRHPADDHPDGASSSSPSNTALRPRSPARPRA